MTIKIYVPAIALAIFCGGMTRAQAQHRPASTLEAQLTARDSLLFDAVLVNCNMAVVKDMFTPGFTWTVDKGDGKSPAVTPGAEFIDNIKRRCARKNAGITVKRLLVKDQTQVSSLGPAEAMQTGIQQFYITRPGQAGQLAEESHFIRLWRKTGGTWRIAREMDYQVNLPSPQDASVNTDLYRQVTTADSLMFDAYNRRDMAVFQCFFSPDLEFCHDKGGLSHYDDNMKNFKQHFTDPAFATRRELVAGSVEVYPLNNYGAVEIGVHRFYTRANGRDNLDATAKFINTWHLVNNQWKLTRIISFDHK